MPGNKQKRPSIETEETKTTKKVKLEVEENKSNDILEDLTDEDDKENIPPAITQFSGLMRITILQDDLKLEAKEHDKGTSYSLNWYDPNSDNKWPITLGKLWKRKDSNKVSVMSSLPSNPSLKSLFDKCKF